MFTKYFHCFPESNFPQKLSIMREISKRYRGVVAEGPGDYGPPVSQNRPIFGHLNVSSENFRTWPPCSTGATTPLKRHHTVALLERQGMCNPTKGQVSGSTWLLTRGECARDGAETAILVSIILHSIKNGYYTNTIQSSKKA